MYVVLLFFLFYDFYLDFWIIGLLLTWRDYETKSLAGPTFRIWKLADDVIARPMAVKFNAVIGWGQFPKFENARMPC